MYKKTDSAKLEGQPEDKLSIVGLHLITVFEILSRDSINCAQTPEFQKLWYNKLDVQSHYICGHLFYSFRNIKTWIEIELLLMTQTNWKKFAMH